MNRAACKLLCMWLEASRWRVGIFWISTIIHFGQAGWLIADPVTTSQVSAIAPTVQLLGVPGAIAAFLVAASSATLAMMWNGRAPWPLRIGLLIPQQLLLMSTMFAIIGLILAGHYADLEPRPRSFIAADQYDGTLLIAFLHSLALIDYILSEIVIGLHKVRLGQPEH